jgi:hypothetical protein
MRGFQKTQQNHHKESIPTAKHQQIAESTIPCKDLYSVRSKRSIQPHTHKERRGMENRL